MGLFRSNSSTTKCYRCGKKISEPAGGAAQALLNPSFSFSSSMTYPCKSCGTIFCLDCMAVIKKSKTCPKCGQDIGW